MQLPAGTRLLIGFDMPVVDVARASDPSDAEGEETDAEVEVAKGPGAFLSTIDQLRRKGFHRLFVDGRTVTLDDVDQAALKDLPSLRVIVDRVKLDTEDLRTRLTDSIETSYREGGGAAFAIEDAVGDESTGAKVHFFSERFECRDCAITYETPQPRLFSFNNPFGACPTCHGFGNIIELDMDLVVPDKSKSIPHGAI